jgi:hypothetical protein
VDLPTVQVKEFQEIYSFFNSKCWRTIWGSKKGKRLIQEQFGHQAANIAKGNRQT